jgi:hypothetical protein
MSDDDLGKRLTKRHEDVDAKGKRTRECASHKESHVPYGSAESKIMSVILSPL